MFTGLVVAGLTTLKRESILNEGEGGYSVEILRQMWDGGQSTCLGASSTETKWRNGFGSDTQYGSAKLAFTGLPSLSKSIKKHWRTRIALYRNVLTGHVHRWFTHASVHWALSLKTCLYNLSGLGSSVSTQHLTGLNSSMETRVLPPASARLALEQKRPRNSRLMTIADFCLVPQNRRLSSAPAIHKV